MTALSNVKILDLTTLLPGPYATMVLADFGAEVLKVSSKSRADLVLDSKIHAKNSEVSANQAWLNRNKKTISLNLKHPKAVEIIKELIMDYDILIEQFRPGVMDRLGLGYEELSRINPRLIYCSLTGYGQTGNLKDRAGHDINYISRSGLVSHSGKKETGPSLMNFQIADIAVGSSNSIIGILMALNYRNMTGEGQYIDVAMLDGLMAFNSLDGAGFLAGGEEPGMESGLLNGGSAYDFYQTKDGRYMSVGSLEPKFWQEFCMTMGHEEWIKGTVRPENLAKLKLEIKEVFLQKTQEEWSEIFKTKDCCVEPVLSLQEAFYKDEHIRQRGLIVEVPDKKGNKLLQYSASFKLSKTPAGYRHAGYELGADTGDILQKLGYTETDIIALEQDGVLD